MIGLHVFGFPSAARFRSTVEFAMNNFRRDLTSYMQSVDEALKLMDHLDSLEVLVYQDIHVENIIILGLMKMVIFVPIANQQEVSKQLFPRS